MASTIDEITINYEENGILLVKELDKSILTKGAWTTILFRYTQWDNKIEDYGPIRYTIRRYRKIGSDYRPQSKFNISSTKQANQIVETLTGWIALDESKK